MKKSMFECLLCKEDQRYQIAEFQKIQNFSLYEERQEWQKYCVFSIAMVFSQFLLVMMYLLFQTCLQYYNKQFQYVEMTRNDFCVLVGLYDGMVKMCDQFFDQQ
eukprot:TRINITY_DN3771_c0_g2_i1.p13 TRINITY_DN3771_c0_g2~~TRINITY_DN3771_c0_g2_i1.p13  ORF type:complete len:104 (-),score=8.87 TRINITY_DN3771_c0_g2_i1:101-412(-)